MKRLLVFADGTKGGGASGLREMIEYSKTIPPSLQVEICAVISPYPEGGAHRHATKHDIPFECWNGPYDANGYRSLVAKYQADYVMGSGHLKMFRGLNPRKTINIHPALTPADGTSGKFGGKGMHGDNVHHAVNKSFRKKEIVQTGVTIHFATQQYDEGPVIWQKAILLRDEDAPDSIGNRANQIERAYQSDVVNLVVNELVRLEGEPGNWEVVADKSVRGFPGLMATRWV